MGVDLKSGNVEMWMILTPELLALSQALVLMTLGILLVVLWTLSVTMATRQGLGEK
jgi:hypothetical protein